MKGEPVKGKKIERVKRKALKKNENREKY